MGKNYQSYCFIGFIIFFIIGCAGTKTSSIADPQDKTDSPAYTDITLIIEEQNEKIKNIEKTLLTYQAMIDDQSRIIDIYDDNNQNMREFRKKLDDDVQSILNDSQTGDVEQEITNNLIKMHRKIQILEDRTFYTDSLYFEVVNDLVMIENKITSLISSYREMSEITGVKKTKIIPKITNEEYTAKYIESLSNYQNGEWNMSLDGFKFLIQADSNHDLADNSQYWIAEIYYAQKEYRRSIKEFEKVFTFPGTNKSDDAQFKIGLCYINIGQINKAKQEFENLLEFYPNSEYLKKTQEYMQQY